MTRTQCIFLRNVFTPAFVGAFLIMFSTHGTLAGIPTMGSDFKKSVNACSLKPAQRTAMSEQLSKLSERYYLAALEAMDHPDFFEKVQAEVRQALKDLQRQAGDACWPLVLGTAE